MKERKLKRLAVILGVLILVLALAIPVFADVATVASDEAVEASSNSIGTKAIACAIAIAAVASAGAIAMSIAAKGATDGMARQPEKSGEIRTTLMLSLVFIETAIIYALLVVILILFVL